jgi:hypothetical protein
MRARKHTKAATIRSLCVWCSALHVHNSAITVILLLMCNTPLMCAQPNLIQLVLGLDQNLAAAATADTAQRVHQNLLPLYQKSTILIMMYSGVSLWVGRVEEWSGAPGIIV